MGGLVFSVMEGLDVQLSQRDLFCLQVADQRHAQKNKAMDKQLTHQLLVARDLHPTTLCSNTPMSKIKGVAIPEKPNKEERISRTP